MDWHVLLAFAGITVVFSLLPGPAAALVVHQAAKGGLRSGFGAAFGNASTLLLHAALAGVGLAAALARSASLYQAIRVAGGVYLLGFGLWQLRGAWKEHSARVAAECARAPARVASPAREGRAHAGSAASTRSFRRAYVRAVGVNLFNPKPPLFFAAFLPQFLAPGSSYLAGALLLGAVAVVIDVVWFAILATLVVWAHRRALWARTALWPDVAAGSLMAGFGAAVLWRARP